jgi:hypothetical protein
LKRSRSDIGLQGNFFQIKELNEETKTNLTNFVLSHAAQLVEQEKFVAVKVEEYKPPRSLSANALYWLWMSELANHFKKKGRAESKDDMHDLMRHKFLGWTEARKIGKTKINSTLKSTTKLNKSEMCFYMEKVAAWAAEVGCFLTDPAESQYRQFIDKQNG